MSDLWHSRMPVVYHQQQFVMDQAIRGNDMRLIGRIRPAGETRSPPSRFLDDQITSRAVPGIELMLIEPVETTGRHPTKIHGRRPQPPDRHPGADKPGEYLQRTIRLIQVRIGETRDQAGSQDRNFLADRYLLIIQRSAKSPLRKIELVDERIIYHPND